MCSSYFQTLLLLIKSLNYTIIIVNIISLIIEKFNIQATNLFIFTFILDKKKQI